MKKMNDALYKQTYKAMCDAWAILDSFQSMGKFDYETEYKQLDKAIDDLYFWYNKKENKGK